MIHFNLNIDLFYDSELKNDSEIKAIACIEYPVLHIIAKTLETTEEQYDELDKFIVQTANNHNGFSIEDFVSLTGLNPNVFDYRANELVKQEYIALSEDIITPITKGFEFLNDPSFERKIEKTRSFLLDGFTHQPLNSYFYKDGKDNFISEEEKDSYGNKLFNPSIIHNPPSKHIKNLILNIPVEDRSYYNIPAGLKDIIDYDYLLMTYPLAIVISRTKSGKNKKRMMDLNGFYANEEQVSNIQNLLKDEINKVEIVIEDKDFVRNEATIKKIQFKNTWSKTRTIEGNRIFNITKDKLKHFIQKLYNLESIDEKNILLKDAEIKIKVDKVLFETVGADRKKLIESCLRKRDYFRQYEGTGVWLVFWEIIIADEFIQNLVDLYKVLLEEISISDLLTMYKNKYKVLRQYLIAIERFDKLEELDIYLFLYSRESNFSKNYMTFINE